MGLSFGGTEKRDEQPLKLNAKPVHRLPAINIRFILCAA